MALPRESDMSQELRALLVAAAARLDAPIAQPPAEPEPGESRERWRDRVAFARTQHDGAALASTTLTREILGDEPARDEVRAAWHEVPVDGGSIAVRSYVPPGDGPFGVVLLVHGGAYWMGGGAAGFLLNDATCREVSLEAGVVVVNVDHRLAPEHRFPVPVDDVEAAVRWVVDGDSRLPVDASRVVGYGISSGGSIVGLVAQRLAGGPAALAGTVLQHPSLDLTLSSSRFAGDAEAIEGGRRLVRLYGGEDADTQAMSPGLAADLGGVPPTLVIVATHDHLADDGIRYAERLREAGVAVDLVERPTTHTLGLPGDIRAVRRAVVAWIRERIGA